MKKGIRYLVIIILLAMATLTGCGKKEITSGGKVIIRYANWETLPEQVASIRKVVDAFNKQSKDIWVKYEFTETYDKVMVRIAGGDAPDVFFWHNELLPQLVVKGVVLDLAPYIKKSGLDLSEHFPLVVSLYEYNGAMYALPLSFNAGDTLIYNKTLFDKAGISYPDENWTWEDFRQGCKKLTRDLDGDGRIDQLGAFQPSHRFIVTSFGGRMLDEKTKKCLIDSPEVRKSIQFFGDLVKGGNMIPRTSRNERDLEAFMTGRVAMINGWPFLLGDLRKIKDFDWDITLPPKTEDGRREVCYAGGGCLAIFKGTKYPDEAWEFVKFYAGEEAQRILAESGNNIPALKSVAYSLFCNIAPPPKNIKVFLEGEKYAIIPPRLLIANQFETTIMNPQIDLFFMGKQTLQKTINNITVGGNKLLEEESKR